MEKSPVALIEFPADEPERARRFWTGLLGGSLESRTAEEGEGWQMRSKGPAVGVHARGPGPGDSFSLPNRAPIAVRKVERPESGRARTVISRTLPYNNFKNAVAKRDRDRVAEVWEDLRGVETAEGDHV
jgi:hypothetical protein